MLLFCFEGFFFVGILFFSVCVYDFFIETVTPSLVL